MLQTSILSVTIRQTKFGIDESPHFQPRVLSLNLK